MDNERTKVEAIKGEPLRFYVKSDSDRLPYLVDLLLNSGNGACSCKSFQCSKSPAIKEGKPLHTHYTMCKHIIRCREYYTMHTLKNLARLIKDKEMFNNINDLLNNLLD